MGGRTAPALEPRLAARPVGPSAGQREWTQLAGEGRQRKEKRRSQRRRVSRAGRSRRSARIRRPAANQCWRLLRKTRGGEVAGSEGSTVGRSEMLSDRQVGDHCPCIAERAAS